MEVHRVRKGLVRISEVEWRYLIHTRRGWWVQMREKRLSMGWDKNEMWHWVLSVISIRATCCSNHLSLKNKWSHNKQSSSMGYQVTSGGITRELDKEPSLHCSSIYITYKWSVLQQYLTNPKVHTTTSCPLLIHMCFP